MQNNIRNTNLRFNLDKEQQRRAWEYLQTMDRQDFKSYSQVISLAFSGVFSNVINLNFISGYIFDFVVPKQHAMKLFHKNYT